VLNESIYYSDYVKKDFASIDNLDKFPVLTKNVLRDLHAKIITSDSRISIIRSTAGTTGTPLSVAVDKEAHAWQLATRYFLFGWYGIRIGDREARFWGRPLSGISCNIKDALLNRKRFSFCGETSAEQLIEYESLISYNPDYLYGYSSLIVNAAIFIENNGLKAPKLKAVICTAEVLGKLQRRLIQRVFKCPVVVEYGCTESDILAFECEFGSMHIMSHNIHVHAPVDRGGLIYTDLNNLAMPLIKYNIGDLVAIDYTAACDCKRNLPIICHLEGREIGQILTFADGSTVHAVSFAYLIEDIAEVGFVDILQFKIIFKNNHLYFLFDANGDIEKFENEMRCGVDKIVKSKVNYSFVYGSINSGKYSKYSYFESI
jgi:phenylacetate-CoA ligase